MPVDLVLGPLDVAVEGNGHLEDRILHMLTLFRVPRGAHGVHNIYRGNNFLHGRSDLPELREESQLDRLGEV
jgi:hypothetical protein